MLLVLGLIILPQNTLAFNYADFGDLVWYDSNSDGIKDSGEPGIDNVWVELHEGSAMIAGGTTFGGGTYGFTLTGDHPSQTYSIWVDITTLPTGLFPTFDYDGIGTPNIASIFVSSSGSYNFMDFGYGPNPPAVPEPTTMLLFGAGLVGLAGFGRKKFKK